MDKRKVHIDEFFARQMDDKAQAPPPAVWEALDKRLDASAGRKKPFPVWWFLTIGGLILISATAIIANYTINSSQPAIVAGKQTIVADDKPVASTNVVAPTAETIIPPTDNKSIAKVMSTPGVDDNSKANNSQPHINSSIQEQQIITHKKQTIGKVPQGNLQQLSNQSSVSTVSKSTAKLPLLPRGKDDFAKLNSNDLVINTNPKTNNMTPATTVPIVAPMQPETIDADLPLLETKKNSKQQLFGLPVEELVASLQPMPMTKVYQKSKAMNIPTPADDDNSNELQPLLASTDDVQKQPETSSLSDAPDKEKTDDLTVDETPKQKKKISLPLELGVKAGYAMGFDRNWRANKVAFAPYVSYKLPAGFSLILQPTYHAGNASTGQFENGNQNYYQITGTTFDSTGRVVRGAIDSTVVTANPPDTVFRTYTYKQTYDSVHTSYNVSQKRLWDIELPLMIKYNISSKFAVFVGASATYSSVLQTELKEERFSLSKEVVENINPETFYVTYQGQQPPVGPTRKGFDEVFVNTGTPFSNYNPRQATTTKNFMRYGFMLGASYNFNDHWLIDVMMHKTGVDVNAVPDKELQKLYSQPYLRVMVGYKLFKTKALK